MCAMRWKDWSTKEVVRGLEHVRGMLRGLTGPVRIGHCTESGRECRAPKWPRVLKGDICEPLVIWGP